MILQLLTIVIAYSVASSSLVPTAENSKSDPESPAQFQQVSTEPTKSNGKTRIQRFVCGECGKQSIYLQTDRLTCRSCGSRRLHKNFWGALLSFNC